IVGVERGSCGDCDGRHNHQLYYAVVAAYASGYWLPSVWTHTGLDVRADGDGGATIHGQHHVY
ncbi:hypothetical protein, partial [Vibrio cidicii]|uniref:hypothetical protein n=1 Tax=Vibrio cidicii TaxID=1763883 RepID=UPI0037043EB5